MFQSIPQWVLPGARFDMDFANNRYWGGSIYLGQSGGNGMRGNMIQPGGSTTVANAFFCPDSTGLLRSFPLNSARITPGLGLWAEKSTTNYALQCRDFTNASWTLTSMTATKTSIIGATGSTGASRLTATGPDATATQAITLTSRQLVSSVYVKRNTGSGSVYITQDNWSTQTDITAQVDAGGFSLAQLPNATLANPTVGIKIATSGDVIDVDFWQTESNDYPTTRILTTTVGRTRGTDMPAFGTDSTNYNDGIRVILDTFSNTPMSCLAIYSGNGVTGHIVKGGGNNAVTRLTGGADGGQASFGTSATGTLAVSANSGTSAGANACTGTGAINKAAGRMRGSGCDVCLNGGAIASGTSIPEVVTDTHVGLGNNGAGTLALGGYISRVTIWNREITDGQMIEWTTPGTIGGL